MRQIADMTVPIAHFLKPYVDGKVPQISSTSIERAVALDNRVQLELSNGDRIIADHVIVATGFIINFDKLPFLDTELKSAIVRETGSIEYPRLNEHFESSISGLYFAGPLSSRSHGPTFRFILGLGKTSKTIINSIRRR
ncbi:UNVERIFIED_CONTAM: pyruvate/2-oxoglutarate dehydrogenase complex dihydrolipoamide dehydrogenase (E3) component [Paenibacillus phyllosphaerae]